MNKESYITVIELYKNCLIYVLENDKKVDADLFTEALRKLNRAIDEAIVNDQPYDNLKELKNYISVLKYDILMNHGKY